VVQGQNRHDVDLTETLSIHFPGC